MKHRPSLKAFLASQSGSMSVEFVIIIPLLLLWMVFSFLFFDAYKTNSQTEKVAFTVSDIMSRHEAVDATDLTYLASLQDKMLPPRLDQRATRITSICFEDNTYKVLWSFAKKDAGVEGYAPMTDDTIPRSLMPAMAAQDSIILTEVRARWEPVTSFGGLRDRVWINELVTRPRFVRIIPHSDLNSNTICPINVDGTTPPGGGEEEDGTTGS